MFLWYGDKEHILKRSVVGTDSLDWMPCDVMANGTIVDMYTEE